MKFKLVIIVTLNYNNKLTLIYNKNIQSFLPAQMQDKNYFKTIENVE